MANHKFVAQVWTAGQVIGLIHDIPSCAELVSRIEREAVETLSKASSLYVGEGQVPRESGQVQQTGREGKQAQSQQNPGAEVWGVGKSKL